MEQRPVQGGRGRHDLGSGGLTAVVALVRRDPIWISALTFVVLLARGLTPFVRPQYMTDEPGAFAAAALADPVGSVLAPWNGFLYVATRLAHVSLVQFPQSIAPAAAVLWLYAVIAVVAALLASDRLAHAIPDRRARLALAVALAVLPGSRIPLASVLNAHWYLAIGLAALALAEDRPRWRLADLAGCGLAALSGPAALVLAPVYWIRARESRHRRSLAVVITVGALAQLVAFVGIERSSALGADAARVLMERLALAVLGESVGLSVSSIAPLALVGLAVASVLIVLARDVRRGTLATLALLAAALAVAGISTPADFSSPSSNTRYFLALSVLVALVVITGVVRRRPLALALAAVMAFGVVADFRLPVYPDARWAAAAACLESQGPCRVVTFTPAWSFTWPGREDYVRPVRSLDILERDCCVGRSPETDPP